MTGDAGQLRTALQSAALASDAGREFLAERDKLRAALKPFADYLTVWEEASQNEVHDTSDHDDMAIGCIARGSPTVGDCRRAREVLKP